MASKKQQTPHQTNETPTGQFFHLPMAAVSPIQETAIQLYTLGLNVFPLPYGKKGGYRWGMMQYTRLSAYHVHPLFRDNCNIAVMTGKTSGNLFVIDCETKAVFAHHKKLLKAAGIPIWSVRSMGRRGGGHLYLRCSEGEVKNIRPGERKDLEIRGNRCYVLCPPSLHPQTNRTYEWDIRETPEPPLVTLAQVRWLGLSLIKDSPKRYQPQPFSELSARTRDFLLNGVPEGTRNNRLFTAACDLAGNDYDEYDAQRLLIPIACKIGLPEHEIRATIHSAYKKSRTPAKPPAPEKPKKPRYSSWQKAQHWADNRAWTGRTGQTDRAVFLACCERGKIANEHGTFRASVREVAEIARTADKTAALALKRLQTAGWLIFCGRDRETGSYLYRLGTATTRPSDEDQKARKDNLRDDYTNPSSSPYSVGATQVFSPLFSDAAEFRALNKTAYRVYLFLKQQKQPVKPGIVRVEMKLSASQVSRALKKLAGYGLIMKVGASYSAVAATLSDLDEMVARPAGTLGRGEKRRRKHQKERSDRAGAKLYKARFVVGRKLVPSEAFRYQTKDSSGEPK